jgi:hypothetical protein
MQYLTRLPSPSFRGSKWALVGLFLSAGLLLAAGLVHGAMSGRWGPPHDVALAADALQSTPSTIGPWQMESPHELSDDEAGILRCQSYVMRTYRHTQTNAQVRMAVLMGPPDRMAAHRPEICYSTRSYRLRTGRHRVVMDSADDSEDSFWRVTFDATDVDGGVLCTYYAWSNGAGWRAPDDARFAYPGEWFLYKLQVSTHLATEPALAATDPAREFLADFLTVMDPIVRRRSE